MYSIDDSMYDVLDTNIKETAIMNKIHQENLRTNEWMREELAAILLQPGYTERRKGLRKYVVAHRLVDPDQWIEGVSALLEDKPGVKSDAQGLANSITEKTLQGLALGILTPIDVCRAILDPVVYGQPSNKSATGYAFGQPNMEKLGFSTETSLDKLIEEERDNYGLSTLLKREISLEGVGLDRIHATVFQLLNDELGSLNEIMEAIGNAAPGNEELIVAIKHGIEQLTTTPPPHPEAAVLSELHAAVTSALMADDSSPLVEQVYDGEADIIYVPIERPRAEAMVALDTLASALGITSITDTFDQSDKAGKALAKKASKKTANVGLTIGTVETVKEAGVPNLVKVDVSKVADIFPGCKRAKGFDFDIPHFEWDGPHPDVPEIDPDFVWDKDALRRILYGLLMNKPVYLHGHTGTGKTTHIEQVSAVLRWPLHRLNLHSEISEMDLLGRDRLKNDSGTTISEYEEGILPQVMAKPCILLLDEVDFIRSGVAYILQRPLEGKGLILTVDAARFIKPHPLFRFVGAGNTQMKGDEYGMYREAKIQSSAFINRWQVWAEITYMAKPQRRKLLKAKVDGLSDDLADKIVQYSGEHLRAFTSAEIIQPLSPRDYIEAGAQMVAYMGMGLSLDEAVKEALTGTILDAAVPQDRQVLRGIVKNVFDINA